LELIQTETSIFRFKTPKADYMTGLFIASRQCDLICVYFSFGIQFEMFGKTKNKLKIGGNNYDTC
jgi:hypothetical protein